MHAVYFVRPGDNEELRYSLRSVEQNTAVENLTVIGDKPDWCKPDEFIQGNPGSEKYPNVLVNLFHALSRYQGDFTIFNDDFYVLKPVENLPLYYMQSLAQHAATANVQYPEGKLRRGMMFEMVGYLTTLGNPDPKSFEVHVPIPVNGAALEGMIYDYWTAGDPYPLMWRSLFGNLSGEPIEYRSDVLYHGPNDFGGAKDFASTADRSAALVLPLLAERFPEPSRWET